MTISEIETTLSTLRTRHQNLDEAMLTTLLSAGGWDAGSINDAIQLFRGTPKQPVLEKEMPTFPVVETLSILPPRVDEQHLLSSHDESDEVVAKEVTEPLEKEPERQSLIPPVEVTSNEGAYIPDNLPLKPFESTAHVWPFSRYKEVFHGEVMPQKTEAAPESAAGPQAEGHEPKKPEKPSTPMSGKDEKLIVMACTMLLLVLLLLWYMYRNGRM